MLRTHLFSRSYFTDCFAEYEQRTLYGAILVTLATLLRLINCRFIIIIIIIIIISIIILFIYLFIMNFVQNTQT